MVKDKISTMEKLLASLSKTNLIFEQGQEVEGKIVALSDKEIVVDLGSKSEGVIFKKDLPYEFIENLKIGDKITAFVQEVENEEGQVVLTIQKAGKTKLQDVSKEAELKHWEELAKKYKKEEIIQGKVVKITQFGIFVQLEQGLEGLIHSSKLGSDSSFVVGQEISCLVDSIDPKKQRISLVPVITSTKGLIYK